MLGNQAGERTPSRSMPGPFSQQSSAAWPSLALSAPAGDGPVALKGPEVVDADGVIQVGGALHSSDPPAEAVSLHRRPVIEGVSPQLPLLREVVRRHAGHPGRQTVSVQQELLPLAPDVGAVQGDIDGQISDDLHTQAVGVLLHGLPLGEEPELHRLVIGDLLRQLPPGGLHGRRLVVPQGPVRPVGPGGLVKAGLEGPVQRVLLQPGPLDGEVPHLLCLRPAQAGEGPPQQRLPPRIHGAVVHRRRPGQLGRRQILFCQQPPVRQILRVDEQRVPREGGHAGVGGSPPPRWAPPAVPATTAARRCGESR